MPTYNNGAGYFLYVNDISEVYAYRNIQQGSSMYFMNRNYPVFYIKSVDMFNRATVDSYDLVKQQVAPAQPVPQSQPQVPAATNMASEVPSNYVTKDELSAVVAEAVRNALAANQDAAPVTPTVSKTKGGKS